MAGIAFTAPYQVQLFQLEYPTSYSNEDQATLGWDKKPPRFQFAAQVPFRTSELVQFVAENDVSRFVKVADVALSPVCWMRSIRDLFSRWQFHPFTAVGSVIVPALLAVPMPTAMVNDAVPFVAPVMRPELNPVPETNGATFEESRCPATNTPPPTFSGVFPELTD